MSDEIVVRHCAPTLAGLKTGALFNCPYQSAGELYAWLRGLNCKLSHKGLRVLPLRRDAKRALIYVYRPRKLKADMAKRDVAALLSECGYIPLAPEQCILRLIGRLQSGESFPHEIGLFLGYPSEDVRGFMEQGGRAGKYVGYWCVYGDEERAKKMFSLYDKCFDVYMRQFRNGHSLEKLTVRA